jgi:hypothetical protein
MAALIQTRRHFLRLVSEKTSMRPVEILLDRSETLRVHNLALNEVRPLLGQRGPQRLMKLLGRSRLGGVHAGMVQTENLSQPPVARENLSNHRLASGASIASGD